MITKTLKYMYRDFLKRKQILIIRNGAMISSRLYDTEFDHVIINEPILIIRSGAMISSRLYDTEFDHVIINEPSEFFPDDMFLYKYGIFKNE